MTSPSEAPPCGRSITPQPITPYYFTVNVDTLATGVYGEISIQSLRVELSRLADSLKGGGCRGWTAPDGTTFWATYAENHPSYWLRLQSIEDGIVIHTLRYGHKDTPAMHVVFPAAWCWTHVLSDYEIRTQELAAALQVNVDRIELSWLDLACDTPFDVDEMFTGRRAGYCMSGAAFTPYYTDDRLTGLLLPTKKKDQGLVGYDKTIWEATRDGEFFPALWDHVGLGGEQVGRFELRLRRGRLKKLGIVRCDDLTPAAINEAWTWGTQKYFRMLDAEGNVTPAWAQIQAARFNENPYDMDHDHEQTQTSDEAGDGRPHRDREDLDRRDERRAGLQADDPADGGGVGGRPATGHPVLGGCPGCAHGRRAALQAALPRADVGRPARLLPVQALSSGRREGSTLSTENATTKAADVGEHVRRMQPSSPSRRGPPASPRPPDQRFGLPADETPSPSGRVPPRAGRYP